MVEYLGGETDAMGKLCDSTKWKTYKKSAANSSGFNALAAGTRNGFGKFELIGEACGFWTSTTRDIYLWNNLLDAEYGDRIYVKSIVRTNGFSVRCVKN